MAALGGLTARRSLAAYGRHVYVRHTAAAGAGGISGFFSAPVVPLEEPVITQDLSKHLRVAEQR